MNIRCIVTYLLYSKIPEYDYHISIVSYYVVDSNESGSTFPPINSNYSWMRAVMICHGAAGGGEGDNCKIDTLFLCSNQLDQ